MPKVTSALFDSISGKAGNNVFRRMNGETFYSRRPKSYNISQSAKAKESRSNFSLAIKFAKIVNAQPALKLAWQKAKIKGTTAFNRIVKHNINFVKENQLSVFNIITPKGETFPASSYLVTDISIVFKLENSLLPQSSFKELPFKLVAVVYLSERKKKTLEENLLLSFSDDYPEPLINNIDALSLIIPKDILSHFSGYKKRFIYLSAVFKDPGTSKPKWTSTICIPYSPAE